MLTSRITVPLPSTPSPEDIFSSGLGALFTDDTQNSHGTPGHHILYRSPRFGDMSLRIPAHPDVEEGRKLFAHYLWNAAVIGAEAIESASHDVQVQTDADVSEARMQWNKTYWNMRDLDVLELGAGT